MRLSIILLVSILLQGCGQTFIYEKENILPESTWTYGNKVDFTFEVQDTKALYNMYLDLEHSTDFKSQNMYVKFYTKSPSQKILTDVVSLEMAGKGGIWFGKCNSEWCDLRIPIQSKVYFDELGEYTVTIEQYTRTENLEGLKSIGLQIEDTGKKKK